MRQESILLALVEAMNLVDEKHGTAPALRACVARLVDRSTDVLDAAKHRRHRFEGITRTAGQQTRQRRLAGTGRSPEDHRMQATALDRPAQRLALTQQVLLADITVEPGRPHTISQRSPTRIIFVEQVVVLHGVHCIRPRGQRFRHG